MICCLKRTDIDEKSGMACIVSSEGGVLMPMLGGKEDQIAYLKRKKIPLSRLCRIIKKNK